jgi:hypothetical protein
MTTFFDYLDKLQPFTNKDALRLLRAEGLTSPDLVLEVASSAAELRSALMLRATALDVDLSLADCIHILKAARECHKIDGDSQRMDKIRAALELAKQDPAKGIPLLKSMEVTKVVGTPAEINVPMTLGYLAAGSPSVSTWKDLAVLELSKFEPKKRAQRSPVTLEDLQEGRDKDTMLPWGELDEAHQMKARLIFKFRLSGGQSERSVLEDIRGEGQLYRRALARWNGMEEQARKEIEEEMFGMESPPQDHGSNHGPTSTNFIAELHKLLVSMYNEEELRRLVNTHFKWVAPSLPGVGVSLDSLAFAVVQEVLRKNIPKGDLFAQMKNARSRWSADIQRVQNLSGG